MALLEARLGQRNERLRQRLFVWGGLLDAAGWRFALALGDDGLWLSPGAASDLAQLGRVPATWAELIDISCRLPASRIWKNEEVLIWPGHAASVLCTAEPLTRRETEVLGWLRKGKAGPEIAIILNCAPRTVEKHLANLYRKTGLRQRAALILGQSHATD